MRRKSDAAAEQELARLLGRPLSASAVDDTGWTDLHYAAALNLPRLATTLLATGAGVAAATIKSDREPLGDRVQAVLLSFCCSGWLPGAWEDRFEKDCQGRADGAAPGGIVTDILQWYPRCRRPAACGDPNVRKRPRPQAGRYSDAS